MLPESENKFNHKSSPNIIINTKGEPKLIAMLTQNMATFSLPHIPNKTTLNMTNHDHNKTYPASTDTTVNLNPYAHTSLLPTNCARHAMFVGGSTPGVCPIRSGKSNHTPTCSCRGPQHHRARRREGCSVRKYPTCRRGTPRKSGCAPVE